IGGGQAPDGVVFIAASSGVFSFVVGLVDVEVESQRLFFSEAHGVVQVAVPFLKRVFQVGVVQRGAQNIAKGVSATHKVGAFQAQAVFASLRLGIQSSEVTGI